MEEKSAVVKVSRWVCCSSADKTVCSAWNTWKKRRRSRFSSLDAAGTQWWSETRPGSVWIKIPDPVRRNGGSTVSHAVCHTAHLLSLCVCVFCLKTHKWSACEFVWTRLQSPAFLPVIHFPYSFLSKKPRCDLKENLGRQHIPPVYGSMKLLKCVWG